MMLWTVSLPRKWSIRKIWSSCSVRWMSAFSSRAEFEAMAERLLDHHAAPESTLAVLVLVLIGELRLAELLHHGAKEPIGDREIEDGVALGAVGLFGLFECVTKPVVQLGLRQVALDIHHFFREPLPRSLVDVVDIKLRGSVADEAFQRVVKVVAPAFRGSLRTGHADQRKVLRQHFGAGEVVECRHHQALGQVAGGAEYHHGAGIGWLGLTPRRGRNHLRRLRHPSRTIVSMALLGGLRYCRVTLRILRLWLRGRSALDPRRARRSRSAWPRAPFRRKYAPAASGNGRRAPR